MAGLWARKFDHKNGEDRVCKVCGSAYHTMKPINKCRTCTNASQRLIEEKRRAKNPKKEQYPFDNYTNEAGARFHKIQRELRKAWSEFEKTGDKSYVIQHYEKQLKEIKENGIWQWIWDRKVPRERKDNNLKTKNMIRKDYPDTRGHYEY